MRLVNFQRLQEKFPLTMSELQTVCMEEITVNVDRLRNHWMQECAVIVSDMRDYVEAWMPTKHTVRRSSFMIDTTERLQ